MKTKEFAGFDANSWFRYYTALNKEVPVEKVKDKPYFLDLSDAEKERYKIALDSLKKDRKICPSVRYEVDYKDFE